MTYRTPLAISLIFLATAFVLSGFLFLGTPDVMAQGSLSGPLVPCEGANCQACHLAQLAQNVINFLISAAVFIAVIMFAYAGFLMVTAAGNPSQIQKGRGVFANVLIGFLIALAAWLLIDTVMKVLFQPDPQSGSGGSPLYQQFADSVGPWNQIECVIQPPTSAGPTGQTGTTTPTQQGQVSAGELTDDEARTLLNAAGVQVVSSGNCSDPNNSSCTSLHGMREDTVNQIIEMQNACPSCQITVTGGTETGHASGPQSHGTGYKIDIDDNAQVDSFIQGNLTPSGTRSGDPRYVDNCGNEYVRESTHWDLTVSNGSCSV